MTSHVLLSREDNLAVLTLHKPESRNALGAEMQEELIDHLEALGRDPACGAIVLTGHGEHFCSGGDLNNMRAERTLAFSRDKMAVGARIARALMAGPKPVIAAVEGFAVGAGISLAAGCDYVVAADNALFISAFGKVGILPDIGLLWSLTQRIGIGQAKYMIASARKVGGGEAHRLGLVDQLVAPGQALAAATAVAREFTNTAPLPGTLMKAAYARGMNSLEDALRFELDNQPALYASRDHREAVAAFFDKRQPEFKGF